MYCILALVTLLTFARYSNTRMTKFSSESRFFFSLFFVSTARAASFALLPMIHIQWCQFWPMLVSMWRLSRRSRNAFLRLRRTARGFELRVLRLVNLRWIIIELP